jgi:hypothetical protein
MPKDDENRRRSAENRALDVLITEAKDRDPFVVSAPSSLGTKPEIDLDWSKIEAKVMAAVKEEAPRLERERQRESARMRAMRAGAVILAAAAAVALYVRSSQQESSKTANNGNGSNTQVVADSTPASSLVGVTGEVHIGANLVEPGFVLHANDAIDTNQQARATFERTRKVAWLVEQAEPSSPRHVRQPGEQNDKDKDKDKGARVRVKSAGEPLILGLESGAIEAQVVPVPVGEAFAVDVATDTGSLVRVAVHGTHLRVARAGNRITVDLTEGVVSIGVPPRTGVTYGTLVTAPAHVELDATDLASIRVDHNLNAVRSAIALNPFGTIEASSNSPAGSPQKLALVPTAAKESTLLPAPPNNNNRLTANPPAAAAKEPEAQTATPQAPSKVDPAAPSKASTPPRDAIAAAVRDCAVARSRSGGDVTHVTVSSTLKLRVTNGVVESAQFSPPLPPEIQSCAAQVIYKTKLDETGLVTIPIEFSFSR